MNVARKIGAERLLLATHNAGKAAEISALLAPYGTEVVTAGDLGLPVPVETGTTFAENARIKALAGAEASGLPALADDSGLSVVPLGGDPGVYTADWAETPDGRDFAMAMEKVRKACAEKGAEHLPAAVFHCTLCLAWPDGVTSLVEGTVRGHLEWPPRGENGHGYDPIFVMDGETITFGEMDPDRKAEVSHRADAFSKLVKAHFG
ncbi:non-canonical purine NTP pyrophosphatase [Roseicyclus sp. F158]|uniref:dITP/XTP pyrophosphatase n=1 Tax=Tropicimonas omnivorans TaxID=3075590 RepID=A0ABU3DCP6_9RHOB|nr:non-canonical purine NTP pyrophosphatase [Roseicyclus sp. F158]MDT0681489.1 non-canonical purine NTP pyrophosphatase [Roseicyclus sp. F158]